MRLRPYQESAINAIRTSLSSGTKRPIVCLPTGSGKTPVIVTLLHTLSERFPDERFVCAVHTQELVSQLSETYERVSGGKSAVYSASLKRKELGRVIFAQIQSIYKKACAVGRIKLLVVDECDRIPVEGSGQYRTFIEESTVINPDLRVCGFTATPYRTGSGLVYGEGQSFNELVYDAGIRELINGGWLSKLVSKDGGRPDLAGVHVRNGDYVASELEGVMADEGKVEKAVEEIIRYGSDRKAWLVFCSGVKHATLVSEAFARHNIEAPIIEGNTPDAERKEYIRRYRAKELKCLVNINVLSVGFDAPHVDLVALLRPTKSPGLYYQQVGRGLRISKDKRDCLILDMAGSINEHGPIDTLNDRIKRAKSAKEKGVAPTKTCDECKEIVPAGVRVCPSCGYEFPAPQIAKHNIVASELSALAEVRKVEVTDVTYSVNTPKDVTKKPTLMVHYRRGFEIVAREWISIDSEADPYAHGKALTWLYNIPKMVVDGRSLTIGSGKAMGYTPDGPLEIKTAADMLLFCVCLIKPTAIEVRPNSKKPKYDDIVGRTFPTVAERSSA